ncbi:MAG TPA: Holliday junction branch migration DNA helicase RuvB [Planctomycetia bacterium]|nr:Holliday junction branch migration DNA helicase RuvB [Planctomycetia bacterium]
MARDKVLGGPPPPDETKPQRNPGDEALRPKRLTEVIGQRSVVERLQIVVDAARKRGEGLPHILFDGPPGVGKTTLANVLPAELGVKPIFTSGPALNSPKEILPYLMNLSEKDVLFIDEIHRLPRAVEEFIYPAMEDYRVDIVIGEGLGARTVSMPLKKFTLIGATTRSGMLSGPMRDRFKIQEHLEFYTDEELTTILRINAKKLKMDLESGAAEELARRARGTPRIANTHLYWTRDYATSKADGHVTLDLARAALKMQEVDEVGLDKRDRQYLDTLMRVFGGGPAGVEALAATMNIAVDTLSEEVEPYLLRREFIVRTPRGRRATAAAFDHLGLLIPREFGGGDVGTLF